MTNKDGWLLVKRVLLIILTVMAIGSMGLDLWQSFNQPQFQSRLELVQTNLVLQASELQGDEALNSAKKALLGEQPLKAATEQYQQARDTAEKTRQALVKPAAGSSQALSTPEVSTAKAEQLIDELDLRLGLLQVAQGHTDAAQKLWAQAIQQSGDTPNLEPLSKTAAALDGLWSQPARLFPDAESLFKKNLDGWFRDRALLQFYQLQQRPEALTALKVSQQQAAEQAFNSLVIVGGIPIAGCLLGVLLLLGLGVQWLIRRKQALIDPSSLAAWSTPWDGETVWQVLIFGFFLVGQILAPIAFNFVKSSLGIHPAGLDERGRAFLILLNYLVLAAGGLVVLFGSIRPFRPLPEGWFRITWKGKWLLWGIGGYLAALPLVIVISAINQRIWQGQGGSNPILPIALEGKDNVAIAIFFVTAAVAAPIFEEILFRGFLLPSLTRYMPVWGAIALSSLIFAIAHLSLSEVLPLTVLGMVLGFVYARSRNLLSSMLLHSLWNSGTLLSLFVLGNTAR